MTKQIATVTSSPRNCTCHYELCEAKRSNLRKKCAFTLAEVLITLGIIGVVVAITMPMLIGKYQKMVWYNQFKKAASQLENAVKMYEVDNGCIGNILDCLGGRQLSTGDIVKYFKTSLIINGDDYICSKIQETVYNGSGGGSIECSGTPDAFITTDGIFITMFADEGWGNGGFLDINGPYKGPNKKGRDVFIFYSPGEYVGKKIVWGGSEKLIAANDYDESATCGNCDNWGCGEGCATKLLQEGKMNY